MGKENKELILYNGKIKAEDGYVQAVLCRGEEIVCLGTDEEVLAEKTPVTEIVDLQGKLVLPGFNDSHMHFLDIGYSFRKLNLRDAGSVEDVIAMGKEYLKNKVIPEGGWIEAYNWNDFNWTERRLPTRWDLDQISADIPMVASRVCGHIVIVNSKGLELLGIDKNAPQPLDGSRFDVDENGEPNGVLHELFYRVIEVIPNPSVKEIKEMLMLVAKEASRKGLTSVQTDDLEVIPTHDTADIIKAYMELTEEDALPVRVCEQCYLPTMEKMDRFYQRGFHCEYGNTYYKLGPVKLIADGSLGGRTAWLLDDYSDEAGQRGLQIYKNDQEFFDLVENAHKHHMPVAVHCIGDAAAKQSVDAIEYAMKKHPDIKVRHGIVHAQTLSEDLCRRMKEMDILAYVQPVFIQSDMDMAEDRLGQERMKYSYNYRTMQDMGIRLSMGTDSPVEDMDPIANIYSAVTRKSIAEPDKEPWHPEESLTVEEAVDLYTQGSAYASYDEYRKGIIKPGYLADMTVLSGDIFEVPDDSIKDLQIAMTIVGGSIKYVNA